MDYVSSHWQLVAVVLGAIILLLCYRWVLALCGGVIIVPDDSVGVMDEEICSRRQESPTTGQPDIVAGGGASGGTLVDVLLSQCD